MARLTAPLTDTQIKNAKPKEKEYKLFDGGGLYLNVFPNGAKRWRIKYSFYGKDKLTGIGVYPNLTLAKAREIRDSYKTLLANGIDPLAKQQEEKQKTIQEIQEDIINQEAQFHKVVLNWFDILNIEYITLKKRIRAFERDIFPYFCTYKSNSPQLISNIIRSKSIADIGHGELLKVIKEKEKTAPETAHRLLADCNRIWLYAISHGYTEYNITANISKRDALKTTTETHLPKITDEKILGELLRAIDNYQGGIIVQYALKFVALIPLRADNLCKLKWSMIDFEKQLLTIPRQQMKVKNKNLSDFVLPLPHQVITILKEIHEFTGWGEWVFHGMRNNLTHMNTESPNKALRYMGFNDEFSGRKQVLHSFRGTFRSLADTHALEHNATFEAMERSLDHHDKSAVVRAYSHKADYTQQIKPLLQWWADFCDTLKTT